jgi:hypothetical protein
MVLLLESEDYLVTRLCALHDPKFIPLTHTRPEDGTHDILRAEGEGSVGTAYLDINYGSFDCSSSGEKKKRGGEKHHRQREGGK